MAKLTTWMTLDEIEGMEKRMRDLLGPARRPIPAAERATRFTRQPADALVDALRREHVSYELLPHRHTETATAEAEALEVDPGQVGKTLILKTPFGYARAVLRAVDRLDLEKARRALGTPDVGLADEFELVGAYPEFELGAVPPVGGSYDRVLVDERVFDNPFVVFEAGTHDESVRLRTGVLLTLAEAEVADLAEDADDRGEERRRRRSPSTRLACGRSWSASTTEAGYDTATSGFVSSRAGSSGAPDDRARTSLEETGRSSPHVPEEVVR